MDDFPAGVDTEHIPFTCSFAALGVAVAIVGAATSFWQVLVLLFAVGWIVSPLQTSVSTIVQIATSDEVRGRTAAALGAVASSANIASLGLSGVVAGWIGVRESFVVAGGVIAASSLVALVLSRRGSATDYQVESAPDERHKAIGGAPANERPQTGQMLNPSAARRLVRASRSKANEPD